MELEPLVEQLQKDLPDARLDPKGVANFQSGFLQFMEDALGVRVRHDDTYMRRAPMIIARLDGMQRPAPCSPLYSDLQAQALCLPSRSR